MTVTHAAVLPDHWATADPRGESLSDDRLRLTNEDFAAHVRSTADRLRERGVGPGDVVAAVAGNSVDFVVLMFAIWRLRATLTPVNPVLTQGEIQHQISDSRAILVVEDEAALERHLILDAPVVPIDDLRARSDSDSLSSPDDAYSAHDVALLIYTSGTTARPKGVVLTHENVTAMAQVWIEWLDVTERDRCLLFLPLFHVNGIMVSVVGPLWAGGSVAVQRRFELKGFWDAVERQRPTYFSAVPTILAALSADTDELSVRTSSLRFVGCGAAPASAELLTEFESRFGVPVIEGYGLTECTVAATINPVDGPRKPGTVGLPLPGVDVAVLDSQGRPSREGTGEIVVRGRTVMREYLGLPDETRQVLRDGWLHTGDVGSFDKDGYLVISDRIKDLVIWGGENISSSEVERALAAHPDVLHASVVGRPHPKYGEEPVAFVLPVPGANPQVSELLAFCEPRLARFKIPRQIWVVDELPMNSVGKIVKGSLREKVH